VSSGTLNLAQSNQTQSVALAVSNITTLQQDGNVHCYHYYYFMPNCVKCQRAKTEAKTHVGMARGPARHQVRQMTRV